MDDEWVVLGDRGSGSDTASEDGSESGFSIVRPRRGGDRRAGLVSPVVGDAPVSPPRVAVPQPTPPGLFKVVSYGEAFSALPSGDVGRRHGDEAVLNSIWHALSGTAIGDVAGQGDTVEAPSTAAVPAVPMVTSPTPSFSEATISHDAAALPALSVGMSENAETEEEVEDGASEYGEENGHSDESEDSTSGPNVAPPESASMCDDDAESSGEVQDEGDHVESDDREKDVEPKASSLSGGGECQDIEISDDAAESDNGDCFDLKVNFLISNTEHIARDGGGEHGLPPAESDIEATASSTDKEPAECRGGNDDIDDEGSDVEESKYGYIDMMPSPGRAESIDDGGEKTSGAVETVGIAGRKYDDIDTSDESDYDEDDEGCDCSEVEDSSGTEETSCDKDDDACSSDGEESNGDEDDQDSDIDSLEVEESDYDEEESCDTCDMEDSSEVEDSSGTEDNSCAEDDDACNSDGEKSNGDDNDKDSDIDSPEAEESNSDDGYGSSDTEKSDCDEDDSSVAEEADRNEKHDMDTPDTNESRYHEDIDVTSDTTESDNEEEDDMETSDTTGSDCGEDDDIDSSTAEESDCDEEDDIDSFTEEESDWDDDSDIDSSDVEEDCNEDDDTESSDEELKDIFGYSYARAAYNHNVVQMANKISGVRKDSLNSVCRKYDDIDSSDDEESDSIGDKLYVYNPKPEEHVEPVSGKYDDIDPDVEDGGEVDGHNAKLDGMASNDVEESPTGSAVDEMKKHQAVARETFDDALARAAAAAFESVLKGSCTATALVVATSSGVTRRIVAATGAASSLGAGGARATRRQPRRRTSSGVPVNGSKARGRQTLQSMTT